MKFDCTLTEQIVNIGKKIEEVDSCGPKNIILVQGSEQDRQLSGQNRTALIERVWILSRPPLNARNPLPNVTVSARRVQIVRAILDGDLIQPKCPVVLPCEEDEIKKTTSKGSGKSVSILGS